MTGISTSANAPEPPKRRTIAGPRRLGRRARKAVLVVHVASAGAWIGIDVVLAVLVGMALFTDNPRAAGVSFAALDLVAVWSLLIAGLVCLVTGLTLALGQQLRPGQILVVDHQAGPKPFPDRTGPYRSSPYRCGRGCSGTAAPRRYPGNVDRWRPHLPADRVTGGSHGRCHARRLQALGPHSSPRW